ncbi:MAG: phenylalanine--tRNA ligase subunit beta [Candidatus Omnitrophica bacterium]|nr:phenylalanine--tRNA ligase subunit beta [Candidatus Omnitrophota bacterium]
MKVTYNWLKDFAQLKIAPGRLAEKLTMAGLEVVSLKEIAGDFVFEIEITSNRPDWLSVIGVAREVAAITGAKLKLPRLTSPSLAKAAGLQDFAIEIEDKKDCPLYTAKIIKNVKIAPSPQWLRKRLELVGCRSVNNVVDITNYVLFEYGHPLHAFDLERLRFSSIIIRRGKSQERITTIDAEERIVDRDILVIADKFAPVAVAGVIGGIATQVSNNTRNVLLEAAIFDPLLVRRGRQKLGLQSEAAYRFERGVNPKMLEAASLRATDLILELAAGEYVLSRSCGAIKTKGNSILLDLKEVGRISGANIRTAEIKTTLSNLGFSIRTRAKGKFLVEAPAFRQDVTMTIDLIEELVRIHGYEKIMASLPALKPQPIFGSARDHLGLVKNILVGLGLSEVITHSLVSSQLLSDCGVSTGSTISIKNPLSKEQEILRPTLLPSLARCLAYNLNQKQDYIAIFETAKVFTLSSAGTPQEDLFLGIVLCGEKPLLLTKGLAKEESGPRQLKGIAESLFNRLDIQGHSFINDGIDKAAILLGQEKIGAITALGKEVLLRLDIKNKEVFCLELSLEKILAAMRKERKFNPLPKYPGIERDISIIVKEDAPIREILASVKEIGGEYLAEFKISDSYQGKQIPKGHRSLTLSCLYRLGDRTLTEAEINPVHAQVSAKLKERFGASMR